MNREEIKAILPHREPMLLVDEAALNEDGSATGSYTVRGDEFFLQGHFPGNPVVPGVILCEMMAQTCCVLLNGAAGDGAATPYFTSLDKVKFRRPVKPGETLVTTCSILRSKAIGANTIYFAQATGKVDGQMAVAAQFSFALVAE